MYLLYLRRYESNVGDPPQRKKYYVVKHAGFSVFLWLQKEQTEEALVTIILHFFAQITYVRVKIKSVKFFCVLKASL